MSSEAHLARDPVSGLPSQQPFRAHLAAAFDRAREQERNGALLAVRLDGIQAINAVQGRQSGDEALRAIAYLLESFRSGPGREGCGLFHLGGPLFACVLPACTAAEARSAAEQIHDAVQTSTIYLQRLTVCIAIVSFYELFMEDGTQEQMELRIEQVALHRLAIAARQGANTICDSSETASAVTAGLPSVLLVDPDPDSMELLVRSLEAANLRVQVVQDGESALAAVQAGPPRALICEAMSPRLSGFALRERLQANSQWSGIPFILVSHRKNEDLIRKAVALDIRHFFRKPVSLVEVVGLVENLTRSAAL